MSNNQTSQVVIGDDIILDIRVGWGSPHLTNEEAIYFNFHVTLDEFSWHETIEYGALFELKNTMQLYRVPIDQTQFPNLSEDYEMISAVLSERIFVMENLKMLDRMTKAFESWIKEIFINLGKLDEKSVLIIKQLFFNTKMKLSKYELLLKYTGTSDKSSDSTAKKVASGGRRGSVFTAMTNLLHLPVHSQPKLNSENLEKLQQRDGRGSGAVSAVPSKAKSVVSERPPTGRGGGVPSSRRTSLAYFGLGGKGGTQKTSKASDEDVNSAGGGGAGSGNPTALDIVNNSLLLNTEVQRGQETQQGLVIYEIILKVTGKKLKAPMLFIAHQRYSSFQKLYMKLNEINKQLSPNLSSNTPATSPTKSNPNSNNNSRNSRNSKDNNTTPVVATGKASTASPYADFIHLLSAPFPALPMKCYFGMSLNESELSQR